MGLSAETRRLYAPHPFDQVTAHELCRSVGNAGVTRMVATINEAADTKILEVVIALEDGRDLPLDLQMTVWFLNDSN